MVSLNISMKPKFLRPELLLHPSIPMYLGGVNPRTIKGKEWWDSVRKEVYKKNNFCCWACGVYQLDALYKQTLDAHETYDYDYEKFEAFPGEVVGLCRACHWFIHFRRIRYTHVRKEVIIRGLRLLTDAGLPVPYAQYRYAKYVKLYGLNWGGERYPNLQLQVGLDAAALLSSRWVLVLDGVKYTMGGVVK